MNNRAQMQLINAMIAHDEKSITALEARLDKFAIRKDAVQPSCYRVRMHAWAGALLTLKQGLEGLKLKHDALVDSEAILSSTAKDSKDEDARSVAHRQGELIQQCPAIWISRSIQGAILQDYSECRAGSSPR